jgi:hypothetical protein
MRRSLDTLVRSFLQLVETRNYWLFALLLAPLLLAFVPPHGVLSTNEEHYIGMAMLFPSGVPSDPNSALFGFMPHTFVFSSLTKSLVQLFGYEATQIIGRLLLVIAYSFSLAKLFRTISLPVVEAWIVLIIFFGVDQHILGGEWLFGGYEPKTLAYPLVLFGVAFVLERRVRLAVALFAAATYCHFLVGGFWLAFGLLYLALNRVPFKTLVKMVALYVVLSAPVIYLVFAAHFDDLVGDVSGANYSARWIYKYFSQPHHTAPFSSVWEFRKWAPGIFSSFAMLVICVGLLRGRSRKQGDLALFTAIPVSWLIIATGLTFVDREGYLAGFLMFRPSSVALLLFLSQVAIYLRENTGVALQSGRFAALILLLAMWGPKIGEDALGPIYRVANDREERALLSSFVQEDSRPSDVFLVDPDLAPEFLDFERKTGRPSFVMDVFIPTESAQIVTWYLRRELRNAIFSGECDRVGEHRVNFLVVSASRQVHCGETVLATDSFFVTRIGN